MSKKEAFLAILDSYYSNLLWFRDRVIPPGKKAILETLKVAGHVTTIEAIMSNMPSKPRDIKVKDPCLPFHLKGSRTGILFTHGFGSSPETFRELAHFLHKETGFTCRAVRLSGHGTSVQDLERKNFLDWYKSIEHHYSELEKEVDEIMLLGHSMGSTLSLLFSAYHPVKAVIAISPPIKLHRPDAKFLPLITWFKRYWPTKKSEVASYQKRGHLYYSRRALKGVINLFDLMRVTRSKLHKVKAPIFSCVGLLDPRVNKENMDLLASLVSSEEVKVAYFPESYHSIHHGEEKEQLYSKILEFIKSETK
jgi:carboxylesterase